MTIVDVCEKVKMAASISEHTWVFRLGGSSDRERPNRRVRSSPAVTTHHVDACPCFPPSRGARLCAVVKQNRSIFKDERRWVTRDKL